MYMFKIGETAVYNWPCEEKSEQITIVDCFQQVNYGKTENIYEVKFKESAERPAFNGMLVFESSLRKIK